MVHNLGKIEETASLQKTLLQLDTPQHDCEMWLYGLMKLRLTCLGRKEKNYLLDVGKTHHLVETTSCSEAVLLPPDKDSLVAMREKYILKFFKVLNASKKILTIIYI